jgi:hypothetical protein
MKSGLQRVLQTGYPFWDSARPRPRNGSVSPAPETRWDQRPTLGNKDGEKTERGRESGDYGGRRWRRPDENSKRQRHSEVCVVRLPLPHRIFSIEQQPWRNPLTDLSLKSLWPSALRAPCGPCPHAPCLWGVCGGADRAPHEPCCLLPILFSSGRS